LIILTSGLISGFVGMAAPQYVQYAIDRAVFNRDAGGLCRLFLLRSDASEGQMQAFMTTIIQGVTQLDALDLNAEAQPPNREL